MNKITRKPLLEESLQAIKEYLFSGKVKVGDKMLTEVQLCTMLGIGRSTVREALRVLQAFGYIELRPGKGSYVLQTQELDGNSAVVKWFIENECNNSEILEFRLFFEPYVTKITTERITEDEIRSLSKIIDQYESAFIKDDHDMLFYYEKQFHQKIVAASKNKVFISIYNSLMEFLDIYFFASFSVDETRKKSLIPHKRIFSAIQKHDVELAMKEMHDHMSSTIENMLDTINKYQKKEKI